MHGLRLMKGVLISSKNEMMSDHDTSRQHVYELGAKLKKLKANIAALGNWCQVAKSTREAEERELANIAVKMPSLEAATDEKDRDLHKALLDHVEFEHLLWLLMSNDGNLDSNLVKGIYERFVRTTHMPTLFYHWMLIVIKRIIQNLVTDF